MTLRRFRLASVVLLGLALALVPVGLLARRNRFALPRGPASD